VNPAIAQQMDPGTLGLMMFIFAFTAFVSLWVAFDARERGSSKTVCFLWYFAILLFSPVVVLYVGLRFWEMNMAARTKPPAQTSARPCPYCNVPTPGGAKMCPHCGRIL
jgi:hypothetical protein